MARKYGSIGSFPELWYRHEKLYFSIFFKALLRLNINNDQREDEDAISEVLAELLRKVCYEHPNDVSTPVWEMPTQPKSKADLKGGKIRKRPDFTCTLVNPFAETSELYEIALHVECKRLGQTKGGWNLNKNYIANGINRFDSKDHEYGKFAPSGMMIGYIVSSSPQEILNEINTYLPTQLPPLSFSFDSKVASVEQGITRKHVAPNNFNLLHLWADQR